MMLDFTGSRTLLDSIICRPGLQGGRELSEPRALFEKLGKETLFPALSFPFMRSFSAKPLDTTYVKLGHGGESLCWRKRQKAIVRLEFLLVWLLAVSVQGQAARKLQTASQPAHVPERKARDLTGATSSRCSMHVAKNPSAVCLSRRPAALFRLRVDPRLTTQEPR